MQIVFQAPFHSASGFKAYRPMPSGNLIVLPLLIRKVER